MANKKISQLPENLTPTGEDYFPIVNNGITKRQSLSNLTSFFGGSEKVYFYKIDYNPSNNIPITNPIGITGFTVQNARITAPYLFEAFGHVHNYITDTTYENYYDNFLFEIIEENGVNIDGLQFSALTELSLYLTNNLLATTASTVANKFTVKMYGIKKNEYQKLSKIRGINTFLSNLKGRGSYWRQKVNDGTPESSIKANNLFDVSTSVSYKDPKCLHDFITVLYDRFLGIGDVYNSGLDMESVKRTIWFPNERKHYYNLWPINSINNGTPASITYPTCIGGRMVINSGTNIFSYSGTKPTQVTNSAIFLLDKNGEYIYFTPSPNFKAQEGLIDGRFINDTDIKMPLPIISKTGKYVNNDNDDILVNCISAIRVYLLTDNDNNVCFFVKPIGIDTLIVDYVEDNTNAILYGLFNSVENGRQMVVKFDNSTKTNNKSGNAGWRVTLDNYEFCTLDRVSAKANIVPYKFKRQMGRYSKSSFRNFRLFYGYPDGTISPLSDDEIYHVINSNGAAVKRLVRKNPIN